MSSRSLATSFSDAAVIKTAPPGRPNRYQALPSPSQALPSPPQRELHSARCDPCNPDVIQWQPMRIHRPSIFSENHQNPSSTFANEARNRKNSRHLPASIHNYKPLALFSATMHPVSRSARSNSQSETRYAANLPISRPEFSAREQSPSRPEILESTLLDKSLLSHS
jgi:hypothetical protein